MGLQVESLEVQLQLRDRMNDNYKDILAEQSNQLNLKDGIIINKDKEIKAQKKVIGKQKRAGIFWKVTTAIASALAAALIIQGN